MSIFPLTPTAALVMQLLDTKNSTVPLIEENSFKPEYDPNILGSRLDRCRPEEEGIPSSVIIDFLESLKKDRTLNMHSVTIARNGRIICEASFGAQKLDIWKHTFSACKSVTAIAIGMLIDDGLLKLNECVTDIFKDQISAKVRVKLKDLCVEDLLTMRSSVCFAEADAMTDSDWVKAFFNAPTKGTVGKTFRYNSLNTYILSAIVNKKTGRSLSDFLEERLFDPLGIKGTYWEKCPKGIDKGGWGLYIRPEDFIKIGILVADKGVYQGQRIVSEEFINLATMAHVDVEKESDCFDYGYQIWVGKKNDTFLFNGMLGQNLLCFKRNGIVIASNAGNVEMFQQSTFFKYLDKFFDEDFGDALPRSRKDEFRLKRCIAQLSSYKNKTKKSCYKNFRTLLQNRRFTPTDGHTQAVGLLPLLVQAVENCYSKGFENLEFKLVDKSLSLIYREVDSSVEIPVCFGNVKLSNVKYRNHNFLISSSIRFAENEDGVKVLVIRLDFVETPSSRIIKMFFYDDGSIVCEQSEVPGEEFLIELSDMVMADITDKPFVGAIIEKVGADYIKYRIEKMFNSKLVLESEFIN